MCQLGTFSFFQFIDLSSILILFSKAPVSGVLVGWFLGGEPGAGNIHCNLQIDGI